MWGGDCYIPMSGLTSLAFLHFDRVHKYQHQHPYGHQTTTIASSQPLLVLTEEIMSNVKEERKKKKAAVEPAAAFSWQERKELADKEQEALEKEIQDLKAWTEMIDAMNDDQLKEYLGNRPDQMKSVKIHKTKPNRPRVQHVRKSRTSASVGIMASVWKFHKDDDDGCPMKSNP